MGFVGVIVYDMEWNVSSQQLRGPLGELMSEEETQVGDPRQLPHFLMIEPNRIWNPGNQATTF